MSKMLERVARAIYDSTYAALSKEERDEDWNDMKATFIPDAIAAVEALKEVPIICYDDYKCDKMWKELNSSDVWHLWLNAILKS